MNQNKFWLASNSPRRREILTWAGWPLETVSSNVDETVLDLEMPEDYVCRIALLKCQADPQGAFAGARIISADTIVVFDGRILGKPQTSSDAVEMLAAMRGRTHWVMTAVAVRSAGRDAVRLELCKSQVKMRRYSDDEIRGYVASGDPMDKAGAYAIQNPTVNFTGCMASVMGMPLCHLERTLRDDDNYEPTDWPAVCQKKLEYTCTVTRLIMAGEDAG
jgi:septum formation protein